MRTISLIVSASLVLMAACTSAASTSTVTTPRTSFQERQVLRIDAPSSPIYDELNAKCSDAVGCPGLKIDPSKELIALDRMGNKLLLGPAFLTETDIIRAEATGIGADSPSPTVMWTIAYELTTNGTDALATETSRLLDVPAPRNMIAIVVNGVVVSAANVQTAITSGEGTISGNFDEESARSLAEGLSPSSS